MKKYILVLLLGALGISRVAAQARRTVQSLQLWPEVQAELSFKNGDYLLVSLHGERSTEYVGDKRPMGFDMRRSLLGYEHFWGAHWSAGATARYNGYSSSYDYIIPEIFGRHRGALGPLTFGQRLAFERQIAVADGGLYQLPESQTWASLRADLEKIVPLGQLALRPRLSYEAATHFRLQKQDGDPEERTIQYTSLRAEVGVRFNAWLDVTPWFAYRTQYLETLTQYDPDGNPTSGGKLNVVYPTLGLEARFTMLPARRPTEQPQLPTQH